MALLALAALAAALRTAQAVEPTAVMLHQEPAFAGQSQTWQLDPASPFLLVADLGVGLAGRLGSLQVGAEVGVLLFPLPYFAAKDGACGPMVGARDRPELWWHGRTALVFPDGETVDAGERRFATLPTGALASMILYRRDLGPPPGALLLERRMVVGGGCEDPLEARFFNRLFVPIAQPPERSLCRNVSAPSQSPAGDRRPPLFTRSDSLVLLQPRHLSPLLAPIEHSIQVQLFDAPNCSGASVTFPRQHGDAEIFALRDYDFNNKVRSLLVRYERGALERSTPTAMAPSPSPQTTQSASVSADDANARPVPTPVPTPAPTPVTAAAQKAVPTPVDSLPATAVATAPPSPVETSAPTPLPAAVQVPPASVQSPVTVPPVMAAEDAETLETASAVAGGPTLQPLPPAPLPEAFAVKTEEPAPAAEVAPPPQPTIAVESDTAAIGSLTPDPRSGFTIAAVPQVPAVIATPTPSQGSGAESSRAPSPTAAPPAEAPLSEGERRFSLPAFRQYRLNYCLRWGRDCGEPAAQAWCKAVGYAGASSWQREPHTGALFPTIVMADERICDRYLCDGFKEIVCAK